MARDATAIYIDDSAIRMLSMSGKRPRQWAIEPLEAGLVKDGLIVDEAEVATRIRSLRAKQQSVASRVVAGISGINCMYRFLTLPELPRNVLPEAVRREASRALGVPMEQLYISWQDLPGKPGETLVYVAATARSTVDSLVRTLRRAGLHPYLMDIAPLALARATAERNALIVNLETSSLDVVVKMDGMPEVVRSVPVSRTASREHKLPVVKQELQRTVTFYNSSHPDAPLPDDIPLLVAGELGDAQDSWKELLGRVERHVEPIQPPVESPADFLPYLYAPTIGLALKETAAKGASSYSRINFNALPDTYQPKSVPISNILYPPVLIAGIAAVVLGGYIVLQTRNHTEALRAEEAATSELALSIGTQVSAQRQALEQARNNLIPKAAAREASAEVLDRQLRGYETRKDDINGDLGEVHKTPAGIDIDMISHGGSVVDVTGRGANENAVFSYARQLRSSGRFSLVVLTNTRIDGIRTAFSIVLYK